MNTPQALLLVGSPKGTKSMSHAIGRGLLDRLESGGMTTGTFTVGEALRSTENLHRMHRAMDAAELVVLSFPLYVDQLPAPLVQVLELVAARRKGGPGVAPAAGPRDQKLVAIVQCGFPENSHNQPAVDITLRFAKETSFRWAGALAMGMGGAVGGKALAKGGGMVRNVGRALDLAAAALLRGEEIPIEARELMAKPLMPRWFYLFMANAGWKRILKRHGTKDQAYARPYEHS
jgi:putative NADPH-quinone reductase